MTQSLGDSDYEFVDPDELDSEEETETRVISHGQEGAPTAGPTPPDSQNYGVDDLPPPTYEEALQELRKGGVVEVEEGEDENESLPDLDVIPDFTPADLLPDEYLVQDKDDDLSDQGGTLPRRLPMLDSDDQEPLDDSHEEQDLASRLPSSQESLSAEEPTDSPQPDASGKRKRGGRSRKSPKKKKKRRRKQQVTREEYNRFKAELDEELERLNVEYLPPQLYKELVTGRALKAAMKRMVDQDKHSKLIIHKIVESDEVRQCKTSTQTRKEVGLNYRKGLSEEVKSQPLHAPRKKTRNIEKYNLLKEKVTQFYLDDQASRACPGKGDYVKVDGEKVQKRICNDYVRNLHELFMLENPEMTCSLAFFWSHRPGNVLTSKYLSKDTTCCQKHQNFQLRVKALTKILPRVKSASNPDAFIKEYDTEEKIEQLLGTFDEQSNITRVEYEQWGRVFDEHDKKEKTRVLKHEVDVDTFMKDFMDCYRLFKEHASNANHQYGEQRRLKQNLKYGECLVQVDFIQNYVCMLAEAAQSSFFNQTQVTIHATCIYFRRSPHGPIEHESFVHVSPHNEHHAGMVRGILTQLWETDFADMKEELQLKKVHYYSDSPYSQYRNKYMFDFIEQHERRFKMEATWDYFETGHGKGPCDGIGGTIKRMADQAAKHGRQIQDAFDFVEWGQSGAVKFNVKLVAEETFQAEKERYLALEKEVKTVVGTKKIHAVRKGPNPGTISHRDLSCKCLEQHPCPCQWKVTTLRGATDEEELGTLVTAHTRELKVGDNCLFEFSSQVYLGQVKEMNSRNDNVSFKVYHREGTHIRAEFKMIRSGKRVIMSKYDVHICGPLIPHRRNPEKFKLGLNDQRIFNSKSDGLQM